MPLVSLYIPAMHCSDACFLDAQHRQQTLGVQIPKPCCVQLGTRGGGSEADLDRPGEMVGAEAAAALLVSMCL